jgi:hypothetical protein
MENTLAIHILHEVRVIPRHDCYARLPQVVLHFALHPNSTEILRWDSLATFGSFNQDRLSCSRAS